MIFAIVTSAVGDTAADAKHAEAYGRYLDRLADQGVLVAAGPFSDASGGLMLVRADTAEEALAIARRSPRVAAGVDRCRVRRWLHKTYDSVALLAEDDGATSAVSPVTQPPPSEDAFSIVDAADDPAHADTLVRCFAPQKIAPDDPVRQAYLRRARSRGLRKLLLLYEGQVAGQIELAPPDGCGLPVSAPGATVINCLWVLDAFTGLGAGRRLLAAAAAAIPGADSLVTIAYTSALGKLACGFFEREQFVTVDELSTGRFWGEQPITAYLMWRPLREGAARPSWNEEAVRSGVHFCPAYPWMYGRRLYFGEHYAYRAVLVREGLRRAELLRQFPVLAARRTQTWEVLQVGIPAAALEQATRLIQSALIDDPPYYASIYAPGEQEIRVIYPYRDYRVTRDRSSWTAALRYGLDRGIPERDLVFGPGELFDD